MPPDGVEAVVVGHAVVRVERAEQREPGTRPVHHRDRNRTVESDHRPWRNPFEHLGGDSADDHWSPATTLHGNPPFLGRLESTPNRAATPSGGWSGPVGQ